MSENNLDRFWRLGLITKTLPVVNWKWTKILSKKFCYFYSWDNSYYLLKMKLKCVAIEYVHDSFDRFFILSIFQYLLAVLKNKIIKIYESLAQTMNINVNLNWNWFSSYTTWEWLCYLSCGSQIIAKLTLTNNADTITIYPVDVTQ